MAEQVFFFCHGDGSNGKTKFLIVLRGLLGDYAKQADFSTFLVQRNEKVRNDLACLAGARVITAIEAEEGSRLSMSVIKAWTGGDPVTARFLFAENFTFQPVGKLWLAANNKPTISERNLAAWRRVQLVPFNVTIPEPEQDKEIEFKLLKELPGILNWALDGLADYLKVGLKTPKAVQAATAKYRKENDSLEEFLSECCDFGKLNVCKNTDLYGAYLNFCGMSGLKALSPHKFSPELSARPDITSTRSKFGMVWTGIALKKDWCSFEDKAIPQAVDAKGVALEPNAQASLNSSLRGDFAHLTPKAAPHDDCKATPPIEEQAKAEEQHFEEVAKKYTGKPDKPDKPEQVDHSKEIRIAAILEYGKNGSVDPAIVAGKLSLQVAEVTAWLEANYLRIERSGVVRYMQHPARGEAPA
jgi:P4 family phage/plasmid primase-like protien